MSTIDLWFDHFVNDKICSIFFSVPPDSEDNTGQNLKVIFRKHYNTPVVRALE